MAERMNVNEASEADRHRAMLQRDDRNVFGTEGLQLPAGERRRSAKELPLFIQARHLMKQRRFSEAQELVCQSLPRDEEDLQDDRYFWVLWTGGDLAQTRGDTLVALQSYCNTIQNFPQSIRRSHLERLEQLGIAVARERLLKGGGLAETDAAAILQQILSILQAKDPENAVAFLGMSSARKLYASLEHRGASAVRSPRQR